MREILEGGSVEDRSFAMAMALKEIIGWCNWLNEENMSVKEDPLTTAQLVFENIYEYTPELDGKFDRILNSISDSGDLKPALMIASEEGNLSVWQKIKYLSKTYFNEKCPAEIKEQMLEKKPKPVSSILTFDFEPTKTTKTKDSSTKQTETMSDSTPKSPAQLIKLQQENKQLWRGFSF